MDSADQKMQILQDAFRKMGDLAVAFSGGVDSSFLLAAAHAVLGDRAFAVTAETCFISERESQEAAAFCRQYGIRQIVCHPMPLQSDTIRMNPPDRCYYCKKMLFTKMKDLAAANGAAVLADGSNMDDSADDRPGMRAIRELGICSPLRDAQLHKDEIRVLSAKMGLPTAYHPSNACLATRIPFGQPLTEQALHMVAQAEEYLHQMGFVQVRVRHHGDVARIESPPDDFQRLLSVRCEIAEAFRKIGFSYAALDLIGYRTGSMNEVLR